jgi:hypothetical protein
MGLEALAGREDMTIKDTFIVNTKGPTLRGSRFPPSTRMSE